MGSSGMDPSDHFHDDAYLDNIERQAESRVAPPRGEFEYPNAFDWWWLTRGLAKDKKRAAKSDSSFTGEFRFTLRHQIFRSGGWISMVTLTEKDEAEVQSAISERLAKSGLNLVDVTYCGWSFGDHGQTYGVIVTVN